MKIKNRFYLGTRSKSIKNAADYLNDNHLKYKDKLITWDKLAELLKVELPESSIEYKLFVEHRSRWVKCINSQCSRMEYPVYLNIIQNKGCQFLTGDDAVFKFASKRLIKGFNLQMKTIKESKEMKCKFPEYEKMLSALEMVTEDAHYALIGRMSINKELKGIVDVLPQSIK